MNLNSVFNFIDSKFETKVKCSCIEDDYYPVENLIAADRQKFNLGFMAYNVVKPPIELEFNLMCCIELISIKIWSKINSLKSIGFEIHVKGSDLQSDFRKIGSYFNLKENGIQFVQGKHNDCDIANESSFATSQFYHSVHNQLRKVKIVKIIIKQTERCVPVIKRLEIFGKLSKFATEEQKLNVQRILSAQSDSIALPTILEETANCKNDIETSSFDIPEVFLDAITYEIMALPMVLPSGKTIDNSTLLRHNEQEEKWGRSASDPFSGQMFTNTRKPVLNTNLKVQIDAFLLKNSSTHELSSVPRTVGSIKKRKLDDCNGESSKLSTANESTEKNSFKRNSTQSTSTESRSLDDLVRGALNGGRKYTSLPKEKNGTTPKCFQCYEQQKSHSHTFYKISLCSHFICRNCLVEKNFNICKCGKTFSNIHVNKHHGQMIF